MSRRLAPLVFALLAAASGACIAAPAAAADSAEQAPTAAAAASAAAASEASAAGTAAAATQAVLETTRSSARSTAEWLARGVDSWFGDRPFEDGGKVSDGRFSIGVFKRQDANTDVDLRFTAHYRLPNIEQRAYLFVGRDAQRDVIRDRPDAFTRQQRLLTDRRAERSFLAGLGVSLRESIDFRLGLGAHLKPYVQARFDQPWTVAPDQVIDFRETVFWTEADRFGSTTVLSYDFAVTPTLALRWLNAATITQVSRNFEWSSGLGAYKSLGRQRLLSFELLANGTGTHGSGVGLSDYGVLAKWEQPLYKNWLLGEIVGGHFWPRPQTMSPRGRAWALGGSLKMRF